MMGESHAGGGPRGKGGQGQGQGRAARGGLHVPPTRPPNPLPRLTNPPTSSFKPNKQTHLVPVLATAVAKACEAKPGDAAAPPPARHHPALLAALAAELGVDPEAIADFDLNVCDTQPGVLGGVDSEFVFAGRLDNLAMSYVALAALVDSFGAGTPASVAALEAETEIKAVALFDHEEVGSASAQGAGGPVMRDALFRVSRALAAGAEGAAVRTVQNSFLVSADMASTVDWRVGIWLGRGAGPALRARLALLPYICGHCGAIAVAVRGVVHGSTGSGGAKRSALA